ncbi:extracellular solute-binding protein [Paenibacillus eucommiae]|uniref:Aldouronate transport system substrate-binding protein n=1 Tax=Paenibacillus eucommiae TaxID=1355755 RepID=A0ABS4J3T9_9BACL|nr:extracellular solute-binding protein [Paenibacillus eucommiae]MBP1994506.1 putative aldouronate transport system substrate-binding protein [Paenibacillus eucommiae]
MIVKRSKYLIVFLLIIMVMTSVLSACGSKETGDPKETKEVQSTTTATNTPDGNVNEVIDPLGKYDPPIEVRIGRINDDYKFLPGQTIDKNEVYDDYEKELGVKLINEWVVPSSQYPAKSNVIISSGNIPDVFRVDGLQLRNLVEAGMIEDLTEVYKKYAGEATKKIVTEDGGYAINAATIDGKMYGFPETSQGFWTSNVLWLRQDWLEKLGLQPPKTMDELIHIASEFVKNNPDGVQGTYGLGVSKELGQLNGFFNGFHAYPFQWISDSNGKIVYGGIQPETKAAVLKLAEMYKEGLIDKEFGVKDESKINEAFVAGKLGMIYTHFAYPSVGGIMDLITNHPDAKLSAYPMPSADSEPAKAFVGPTAGMFWVVKKGFKHPEVVIKLANYYIKPDTRTDEEKEAHNKPYQEAGVSPWQYLILAFSSPMTQINEHRRVKAAMLANEQPDKSIMTNNEYGYLKGIYTYLKNPKETNKQEIKTGWMYQGIVGTPNSGAEVLDYYFTNNLTITTPLKVASTPTMSQKMPTLTKMEEVLYTKIILGEAGEADFDKFVADWKKQGGDEITKELNN